MALKARNCMKLLTASGGGTIKPDEDESWRIRNIFCAPSSNDDYLTLYNADRCVGKIRVKTKTGNHLPFPHHYIASDAERIPLTVFDWMRAAGTEMEIPVPSGKDFTITRYAEAGRVCVVYDKYDAGDVGADEPNTPRGAITRYIHYAQAADNVEAASAPVNDSLIWSGGDAWPFDGSSVPLNTVFRILAILASPAAKGDSSNNKGVTTHLQLIRDSAILFDPDRSGIPLLGDVSVIVATVDYKGLGSVLGMMTKEYPLPGLVLAEPLEFGPGEKLDVNLIVSGAAASGILAGEVDVALVLEKQITG